MNILDIFIGLPLIYALYKGFTKGFIYEAATLAALILGVYGAIHFSDFTAEVIQDTFKYESQYMEYISFIVTFIVIVIGINLIGRIIDKLVEAVALGFVNRLFGLAFGLLKGVILLSIIIHLLNYVNDKLNFISQEKKAESLLYEPMSTVSDTLFDFFDSDFSTTKANIEDKIKESTEKVKKSI
ncbi:CvpA family protein [Ancylomarina sp. 16SWW S1-10-2]|uniref:CvpA family protein n=1 Tax=Ancylomarina sp. 16SWW S1-10-2 TaxID=2499681 RepID=UPI0012ADA759|nr:CvpA family protein [Ancylomarina sp. 16SWW S1-10-2]MRT94438.1 CvpA family protein [Ancylomarina sp. 16SWW S1-10-2]